MKPRAVVRAAAAGAIRSSISFRKSAMVSGRCGSWPRLALAAAAQGWNPLSIPNPK